MTSKDNRPEDARDAQKYSLSLLSAALESTADGLLVVNSEGRVARYNRKFAEMWKIPEDVLASYDDDVLLGHVITQLADPGQFLATVKEMYALPEQSSFDQIEFLDGRVFERYSQPQKIENTVVGRVWSFRDITERKQTEEKLKESVARFKALFNATSDSVILVEPDGTILDLNENAAQRRDRDTDTMLGQSLFDFLPPEAATMRREAVERILNERKLVQYDEARDGKHYRIRLFPVLDDLGKVFQVASFSRDITESKRAEEALRESEERYRSILNASPDNITITDLYGRILIVSPVALTMFGCTREEEMLGHPGIDLIVPEDRDRASSNSALMFKGTMTGLTEYRGLRVDGTTFDMEVNGEFIRGADGKPASVVYVIRDITERKRAEEESARLEVQSRQLQKAESLGRMAGAIAHHFNNQLQAVMGNLELANMDLPRGTRPCKALTAAMQAARKAAEVSGLMLTYLGQTPGLSEPLDLSDLCRRDLTLLRASLPTTVVLETDLPSPGPTISANAIQIQHILSNLITNAWEAASDNEGVIQLAVKSVTSAAIPALHRFPVDWRQQTNDYACLEVTDAGCGIEDEDIEKLFDPFFSRKFTGRGLGLSVVLGIVRTHGGAITVESVKGQGSVFRVFFPMSGERVAHRLHEAEKTPEIAGSGTILLVEDDAVVLMTTRAMLEMKWGFTVLTAKDGIDAVEVFRQHQDNIRCVLCDLTMPRMDGWETLAALRQIAPGIPFIMASGYDKAQVMAGDHAELPQAFLHKPYELAALQDALASAMGKGCLD